jgi:hypothetical protein
MRTTIFLTGRASRGRHQPLPRTAQPQLKSERGRKQNINFTGLNFLKIASGYFGSFGKNLLGHAFAHSLPAHACAEDPDSDPLFFAERHDILHR